MNLLSSLLSGFAAAANGTAEIYIRGSSTRATWYGDLEASTSNSSGADITLDAYGSALVYVNQLVDVVVKDEDGKTVRSYGDGYSAPNVEVISPAFTGIDYVTAASAVSEPTTLQAVLDRWLTNSGAPDWKVLIGGVATTLLNAFGSLAGLVYNVKNPAYGAVGDGVANDAAAIQAAIAAAAAAGGGVVFFPKGTYNITSALTGSVVVSLLGVGANESIISINHASANAIQWTAGTFPSSPTFVNGLSFQAGQANSGIALDFQVAPNVLIEQCVFGDNANASGTHVQTIAAGRLRFRNCVFTVQGAAGTSVALAATCETWFESCEFYTLTGAYNGSLLKSRGAVHVENCSFRADGASSGTFYGVEMVNTADQLYITGCRFSGATNYTASIKLIAGGYCQATANLSPLSPLYFMAAGATALATGSFLATNATQNTAGAFTAVTISVDACSFNARLTSTVPTITLPKGFFIGQRLSVMIENKSGVTWGANVTFTGGTSWGVVVTTAADSQMVIGDFVYSDADSAGFPIWTAINLKLGSA